jgi:hypothetical protein
MLPQTLPIRFYLNHRRDIVHSDGGSGVDGIVWKIEVDRADKPGAAKSEPTPFRLLDGLGRALGLETVLFKDGGNASGQGPSQLRQTYSILAQEILEELKEGPLPTHVFVQAGTGDLAAPIAAHFRDALGDRRPRVVVVEPANADCVLESALASQPTPDTGSMETNMESLACREVSRSAWPVLIEEADAFLSISDYAAEATVTLLREGVSGDPSIRIEPSGAAGLAGLIAASFEPALTGPLALGPGSRVLVIGWEGPA